MRFFLRGATTPTATSKPPAIPFACAPLGLKTVCGSICLAPVVGFMEMGEPMP